LLLLKYFYSGQDELRTPHSSLFHSRVLKEDVQWRNFGLRLEYFDINFTQNSFLQDPQLPISSPTILYSARETLLVMAPERVNEVKELLFQLERRIRPLEWDLSKNQINEFKKQQLTKLREQHMQLQGELAQIRPNDEQKSA